MKVCAIHQPNFFPWLGYFDKAARADTFVFLDRADYPKSGKSMGSWCNRVKLRINSSAEWVSCPVVREHGPQPIHTVRIDNSRPWRDTIRKAVQDNYRKAPNFNSAFGLVDNLLAFESELLASFNINAITSIAKHIGIETTWLTESQLPPSDLTATARLVSLVKAVGAEAYLCGGGASGYQDDAAFGTAGLRLVYQEFKPEPYGDPEVFIPGLSIIDWLMHRD